MKDELKPIKNLHRSINNFLIKNTGAVATRLEKIEGPCYKMIDPPPPLDCGDYSVSGDLIFERNGFHIFSVRFSTEIMHGDLED